MFNLVLVVGLSLGAALAFAWSTSLKHRSAGDVPDAFSGELNALRRFARATVSHPLWIAGAAADVVGLALQVLALHLGALAVVQPLLLSGLVFALVLRSRSSSGIGVVEIRWAVVVAASLAGCLLFASAASTVSAGAMSSPNRPSVAVAAVLGVTLVLGCLVYTQITKHQSRLAPALAVAVGTAYAASAALIKAITDVAAHDGIQVLTSWQLYTAIGVGGLGLMLSQLAFQAGSLTASAPIVATVDPLLSVAVGVFVYHEHVGLGPVHGAVLAVLAALLATGVVHLARSDTAHSASSNADELPTEMSVEFQELALTH